jgi:hypothetical protein
MIGLGGHPIANLVFSKIRRTATTYAMKKSAAAHSIRAAIVSFCRETCGRSMKEEAE